MKGQSVIMAILDEYVKVKLVNTSIDYYENLGYEIPRYEYAKGKFRVKNGTEILVRPKDLKHNSNVHVNVACDCCGKEDRIQYGQYNENKSKHDGLYLCPEDARIRRYAENIDLNYALKKIKDFYNDNGRFPKHNEFVADSGFDFTYSKFLTLCQINNSTPQDEYAKIDCFALGKSNRGYYDKYVERFIQESERENDVISYARLRYFNLPDGRWFVDNCPDKFVDSWSKFVAWCGFYSDSATKEQVTNLVFKKAKELNRPLMYDDFRGGGCYNIPFTCIKKYWGTMNKMKEELGLEIIQPQMIKVTQESFNETIRIIKDYLEKDNRDFITRAEWSSLKFVNLYKPSSIENYIKENFNMPLKEYMLTQGIRMGEVGEGLSHKFDDGEFVTSQFEYMFSSYIRKAGLRYNIDYFRDVKYSDFCKDYDGLMNCDYIINYNGKTIYVEIAGIIEEYKKHYYSDNPIISSKSKEKYRQKLKEKEHLLNSNNCIHFILFPCDLTEENMEQVIKNPSIELRKQIELFNKTNIDFVNVRKIGKLDYDNPAVVRHTDWETHRKMYAVE